MAMVMMLLFGAVLVQAANIQFRQAKKLATDPKNPRNVEARRSLGRGDIRAGDGSVLAHSIKTPTGVYKYQREYPTGALMGQITGFDSPIYGRFGIEAQYNSLLSAHAQPARSLSQILSPTTSTDSVALTILPSLQNLAAQQLAGRNGAVVVLNPANGAVLAMYANPTYDPTPLAAPSTKAEQDAWAAYQVKDAAGYAPLVALTYQRSFPPGSTFKVVTSATAYDYRPDLATKYYPDASSIALPNTNLRLQNFGGGTCGGTVAIMLPPSCDTGFAELGMDLGGDLMWKQATEFGFDSRPPLDLPGVAASNFPTPESLKNNGAFLAYDAIGQHDVTATALQNALVAAAIANNGIVMTPHLLREVRDKEGNLVQRYQPLKWLTATTPETAAQISVLMQQVVTQGTAAGVGFLPANEVAAKTGTAQTAAGAVNTSTDDWMIAFAPASHPTVAIAVILPDQALSGTGAEVAGPVMKCMIQGSLAAALGQPVSNTPTTCAG